MFVEPAAGAGMADTPESHPATRSGRRRPPSGARLSAA